MFKKSLLCLAALTLLMQSMAARTEDAGTEVYAVAYIEIVPGKEKEARKLITDHAADARRAAGAVAVDALARVSYPDQFALLEQWQSQKARDDYNSGASATAFRAALGQVESAGLDERIQGPLFVERDRPATIPPVLVMTHIDVIPPALEAARARIRQLVESNRHKNANARFDVLVQGNRPNHMTLIEGWSSSADKRAESAAPETVSFRHDLLPMSGSPYDERIYRPLRE